MALFKKKVDVDEEKWRDGIKKEALGEARTEAAPILKKKIKQDEVDRLTGTKKSKLLENLGKQFTPLGNMASNEKMNRLLGKQTTGTNIDRMLGRDRPTIQVIQSKSENIRKVIGDDEIKAEDRMERIMGKKKPDVEIIEDEFTKRLKRNVRG